jgi:hypothetical protein
MKSYNRVSQFQVAGGSLHLRVNETMCSDIKDAQPTDFKVFIHGFNVARLRADGTVDGMAISFDGKKCASVAKEIGYVLMDVFNGSTEVRAISGSNIQIEPLTKTSVFIRDNSNNSTIKISIKDEIPDLSGYLVTISGLPYSPEEQPCP